MNGLWERGIRRGNPELAIYFHVERGDLYAKFMYTTAVYGDAPKMQADLMHLFEIACVTHCGKERIPRTTAVVWLLLWQVGWPWTWPGLEAEARVKRLEEKKLETMKDNRMSTTLLKWGLADKGG